MTGQSAEEVLFGSPRGGRKGQGLPPLVLEVVRPLEETDLEALNAPSGVSRNVPTVKSLRHGHHKLAQALASVKTDTEASLITGYSLSRISILKADPAFRELLAYYMDNQEAIFVDANERLATLGILATEELQERLETKPEEFMTGTLLDIITTTLRPKGNPGGLGVPSGGASPLPAVQITFVNSQQTIEGVAAPPMIDGE